MVALAAGAARQARLEHRVHREAVTLAMVMVA